MFVGGWVKEHEIMSKSTQNIYSRYEKTYKIIFCLPSPLIYVQNSFSLSSWLAGMRCETCTHAFPTAHMIQKEIKKCKTTLFCWVQNTELHRSLFCHIIYEPGAESF